MIWPFSGPLFLAAVFSFLFHPLYQKISRFFRGRESLAAFATTIIAIVLVVLPVTFLGIQIFKESNGLYQSLVSEGGNDFTASIEGLIGRARGFLPIPEDFKINFNQYAQQGLEILINNLGAVFSSFAKIMLNIFVFFSAFYFLLKDGEKLKNYFVSLSPLADKDDKIIISRLRSAVSATVKGSLVIGIIQGVLTGVGFAIFGVPNATLWGSAAAIASLFPGVGTALVIAPAVVFLFLTGSIFNGIGLLVWGITAVGLIDNFLGPRLVGKNMKIHPLAVFLSSLGGLALFGPLGFIIGPLVMSVCLALIDIYFSLKAKHGK